MDFDPFAYDWEDDSIAEQIPPSDSPKESPKSPVPEGDPIAEQNSLPESPKEDPKSSIPENVPATLKKVPATPKRKRNDVDDTKDRGTNPKRPSPLRQVSTYDALDYPTPRKDDGDATKRTPMKHPDPASEESTPQTVVKGIAGFNIASPDKLEVVGLPAEELENPFASSASRAKPASTPMFSTTSTGFTSTGFTFDPVKKLSSVAKAATPTAPTTATAANGKDLEARKRAASVKDYLDKKSSATAKHAMKAPETPRKTTPTSEPLTPNKPAKPTPTTTTTTARATNTTTTPTTPETPTTKPISRLHATPQIAPQYIPKYASPNSPLKLRDPRTFSVSPPFWTRWPKTRYTALATYLQNTIDFSTFALAENISVEEAAHVFNAVVVGPLQDETEKMAAGAERRMEVLFKTIAEGKVWRVWEAGEEGVRVKGELAGVRPGVVVLVGEQGQAVEVRFGEMCERDRKFVKGCVDEYEWRVLMRRGEREAEA